ncbi:hypothetical protein PG991_006091 [Apiospora marii]|uniref:Aminoglycoside phosphotransferase domain-containing protein n=1 Tax=Apiospora marii TaxID=335849 RepID=A0ABR1SB62_9PEZI
MASRKPRKARNPFADSPSPSSSPKPRAAPNPVPDSPEPPQSDNGYMVGLKRFLGNLMGSSSSTPAPAAPRQGTQDNPFVISPSPSPEPVPRPEPDQSFVVRAPPPAPRLRHAQPVKRSSSPVPVPPVVVPHSPSPAVREQPAVFKAPSPVSIPAPVLLPGLQQHASPSEPFQLSSQVASLADAPVYGQRRAQNPFAYSPSPPPAGNGLHPNAVQGHGIQQHAESRNSQESHSSSTVTDPSSLFGFDDGSWVFPPPVVRRHRVVDDDYESPLFVPPRRETAPIIVLEDDEDGRVVIKEEPTSNAELKVDLVQEPVDAEIDKLAPPVGNESSMELDEELPPPPAVKDELLLTRSNESDAAPVVDKTGTFLPPPTCHQRAERTGLDDDVSPLRLDDIADQAEVSSAVGRSRSRSLETDPSLFGSPVRDDELAVSPEADAQLPDEQPSNDQPYAHDPEVNHPDVMSVGGVSSSGLYDWIGVKWVTKELDEFHPYLEWSLEPLEYEVVMLLKEVVSPLEEYKVTHIHKSNHNTFFAVEWSGESYVLKFTVPVCPVRKTLSEVATMRWTKMMTRLPLPDVVQNLYSTSPINPVGCEWILMRKLPGRPLFEFWRELDMSRKRRIVEQLAEYTVCVFDKAFDGGISTMYPAAPGDPEKRPQWKGMDSTPPFWWNGRNGKKPPRGPYGTYREWAFDRLNLVHADAGRVLPNLQNRIIRLIPWRIQALVNNLKRLHDVLFMDSPQVKEGNEEDKQELPLKGASKDEPIDLLSDDEEDVAMTDSADADNLNNANNLVEAEPLICEEKTMLWHTNLSADNIFVDDTGVVTGILDWENVSAIPRSVACQLPAFLLEGQDRFQEPRIEHYWTFSDTLSHHSSSDEDSEQQEDNEDDDEEQRGRSRRRQRRRRVGPTPAYWNARREWELTQLRFYFERVMAERSLGWHMCHKHHKLKRSFEAAVQYCDDPSLIDVVEAWVRAVEAALAKKKKTGDRSRGLMDVFDLERRIAQGPRAPPGHNDRRPFRRRRA